MKNLKIVATAVLTGIKTSKKCSNQVETRAINKSYMISNVYFASIYQKATDSLCSFVKL